MTDGRCGHGWTHEARRILVGAAITLVLLVVAVVLGIALLIALVA